MKRVLWGIVSLLSIVAMTSCENEHPEIVGGGYVEKEVETIEFTNAYFVYGGDEVGLAGSDCWVVKLYTDMEIDMYGNLIGPGHAMQLMLNAPYNEAQEPSLDKLQGEYFSQSNSGDYSAGTFIYGYMNYLDLPNGRVELPDGTFYASIAEGETKMNADMLDDGKLQITVEDDGTISIEGTLVGKQCRKRKFTWRGDADIRSEVVEQTPNSLLTDDLELTSFTKAHFDDRGDYFYLGNDSYRDILIFLADDTIEFEWGKPVGSGNVLRLELLVPYDTDIRDGIPAGTYPMLVRNQDTSFNKEDITPYHAVPGLPNRFTIPYWSGCWFVEYEDGAWSDRYARIDGGKIIVERDADGTHRFICNLEDCSDPRFKITANATIANENILGIEVDKPKEELEKNSYSIDGEVGLLNSVALEMLGEDIYIVGTPTKDVASAMDMFECEEYIYAAVSPTLVGREVDLMSEENAYTIISMLKGAAIESLSPDATEEISAGSMLFNYEDNVADVRGEITLADGTLLEFRLSAEKQLVINENTIARGSEEKPLRSAFYMEEDGLTYLYFTPAGLDYFQELEVATWYLYFVFDTTLSNGVKHNISAATLEMFGMVDNLDPSSSFDLTAEDMAVASGDFTITRHAAGDYLSIINITVQGVTYKVVFDGMCISASYVPDEKNNYFIYNDKEYVMYSATLTVEESLYKFSFMNSGGKAVELTAPQNFFNGNSYGFSQSADFTVAYNRRTYSKANGDSGTMTAIYNVETQHLELYFTNYNGMEFNYKGTVEIK